MTFPKDDSKVFDNQNLEKGYVLEIQIVDNCNLNCYNCNHFSSIAPQNFLSVKDFSIQLSLIKEKLPQLQRLILIGGEPLLHPNLLDLVQIVRDLFPTIALDILTNGIKLDTLTINELELYKKYQVRFTISAYASIKSSLYESLESKKDHFYYQDIKYRLLFQQSLIDTSGQQPDFEQRENCSLAFLPCLTLKDSKIYICPFSAHIDIYNKQHYLQIPYQSCDYLDLTQNINYQDLINYCYQNKKICTYCKQGDFVLWQLSDKDKFEYLNDKEKLFLNDYNKYNHIFNNRETYDIFKQNGWFNKIEKQYSSLTQEYYHKRFGGQGKIDIIVPYYYVTTEQCQRLKENLLKQTIIQDCIIYFISNNSPCEEIVLQEFNDNQLNVAFLKTPYRNGPGLARELGIQNSYNKYFFFLDIDDCLILYNGLELLYNLAEQYDLDYVVGKTVTYEKTLQQIISQLPNEVSQHGWLYKREYVVNNNIHNIEAFFAEDMYWYMQINNYSHKSMNIDQEIYLYIKDQNNLHAIEFSPEQKKKVHLLIMLLFIQEHPDNKKIQDEFKYIISHLDVNLDQNFLNFCLQKENVDYDKIKEDCNELLPLFPRANFWMVNND